MERFNINEGIQLQREGESLRYKITTTPWASNPTAVDVEVWDITDTSNEIDVSSSTMFGTDSVENDQITLPNVRNLVKSHKYRVDVFFNSQGNTFVVPLYIRAIR